MHEYDVLDAPTMEEFQEDEKRCQEMISWCEYTENNFRNAIVEMLETCCSLAMMKKILDEEYVKFPGVKSKN